MISYNLYWLGVILAFGTLGFHEKRGHFPLLKAKARSDDIVEVDSDDQASQEGKAGSKGVHVTSSPREDSV